MVASRTYENERRVSGGGKNNAYLVPIIAATIPFIKPNQAIHLIKFDLSTDVFA